jgi:hypothetical protein
LDEVVECEALLFRKGDETIRELMREPADHLVRLF